MEINKANCGEKLSESKFREQIVLMRSELRNIRSQMQGLKLKHKKEVLALKEKINLLEHTKRELTPNRNESFVVSEAHTAHGKSARLLGLGTTESPVKEPSMTFRPIGRMVDSWFNDKNGTPRQPTICKNSKGTIDIKDMEIHFPNCKNPRYALDDLADFSHIWIIFIFDRSIENRSSLNEEKHVNSYFSKTKIAPPRLGGKRVGLFSTRSPHRPNLIGLTLAKLESIEGTKINVSGIDLLKGTPILDIKPFIPAYDIPDILSANVCPQNESNIYSAVDKSPKAVMETNAHNKPVVKSVDASNENCDVRTPNWIKAKNIKINFTERSLQDIDSLCKAEDEKFTKLEVIDSIKSVLQADPRSNYRKQKCSDRLYYFSLWNTIHVTTWFDEQKVYKNGKEHFVGETIAEVLKISPLSNMQDLVIDQ